MTHHLDAAASRIFVTALREGRQGELLEALFAGGSATVDPEGLLVIFPAALIEEATKDADR